jgi:phosphatidylethanolamine N-methyltransferase
MVQSLLDPNEQKSWFDFITLATLAIEISLFFILPRKAAKYFYISLFLFWRLAYNLGLGLLLKYQSDTRFLVKWVQKHKLFDEKGPHPKVAKWLKTQLSLKMSTDYDFDVS